MTLSGQCWAYDLDGVICADHRLGISPEDYEDHIDYAEPLYLPKGFIYVVTGRMDKYYKRTAAWLDKYGLTYELYTKPECFRGIENTPHFKAVQYKQCRAELFLESHIWQAEIIARESGKLVFCMEDKRIYRG